MISVILPVYNGSKFLSNAIDSILNQTFVDFEFIIINDGSTDNSLKIIESYQKKDKRIKIVSRGNKGLIETLNEGFSLAKGKYIARQDDDDVSHLTRFEKQVNFLENNIEYALCGTLYNVVDEENNFIRKHYLPSTNENIQKHLFDSCFGHGSVMIRREMILDMKWYRKEALHVEDYDFFIRIAQKHKVYNIPEFLYEWCFRNNSVSYSNFEIQRNKKYLVGESLKSGIPIEEIKLNKDTASQSKARYFDALGAVSLLQGNKLDALRFYSKSLKIDFTLKRFMKLLLSLLSRKLWIVVLEITQKRKYQI